MTRPRQRPAGSRCRVGVTGAAGMLGSALLDVLSSEWDVYATDLHAGRDVQSVRWDTLDLLDTSALDGWLAMSRPEVVIHCAAMVDVDACEQQPHRAEALHDGVVGHIIRRLRGWDGRVVYISSDAVFDGEKASLYNEQDAPNPLNTYGRTKLMGEATALSEAGSLVLRTNIFGWTEGGRPSFAEWVLRGLVEGRELRMFSDVSFTPIHVTHLSAAVARCLERRFTGLFHAAGSTPLSKRDFAVRMAAAFNLPDSHIVACSVDEAGLAAPRAKNMGLSSVRLGSALSPLEGIDEGLSLMRSQYEDGWAATLKRRPLGTGWRFWEGL